MSETLEQLLARCGRGEDDAVATLVRRYQPWAIELAASIVGDRVRAEDVVQESFLAALSALPDLRTPEAFPGWFRQIVRTWACRELRRRDVPSSPISLETRADDRADDRADAGNVLDTETRRSQVRQALASLPRAEREAADLYYLQDRPCREVAVTLGIPVGTVKRRLHDARIRLKGVLAEPCGNDHGETPQNNQKLRF